MADPPRRPDDGRDARRGPRRDHRASAPGGQRGGKRAGRSAGPGARPAGSGSASARPVERPAPRPSGPPLPDGVDWTQLDQDSRRDLRGLPKELAERVGAHLVAAGQLVTDDPDQAYAHAKEARRLASRVPVVREAAGVTGYAAGAWAEALAELRAYRRMAGDERHLPLMADCERALGRPERALSSLDPRRRSSWTPRVGWPAAGRGRRPP